MYTDCQQSIPDGGISISSLWASTRPDDIYLQLTGHEYADIEVKYLIVVEKEGIFKRLCEDNFHLRMGAILITGCGFPDISTRACVARIAEKFQVYIQVYS